MSYFRKGSGIPAILATGFVYTHWQHVHYVFWAIGGFVALKLLWSFRGLVIRREQSFVLSDVDQMDGLQFERYISTLLARHGFTGIELTEQYDLGVDIIAHKNDERWGIQVKRYSGLVKAEAVRQVITGLKLYGCDRSMVITNSNYSKIARQLAAGNNCVLVDRQQLAQLI